MDLVAPDLPLEPGLDIEEIEKRLVVSADRFHSEERHIAFYLREVEKRNLHVERGFSSVCDFSSELIDFSRRKTQYLLFIARRLDSLPLIAGALDDGEVGWTKVREIVKVATPETQEEWLDKAKRSSRRELEKIVKKKQPLSEDFCTLRIPMPESVLNIWVECEEIAERQAERELDPWQVLEQALAEYLLTYAAAEEELISHRQESDEEKEIPPEVRRQVLERDGRRCQFPGCSMRFRLGLHHIIFRSQGGQHVPENLVVLCDSHHTLIHLHKCGVEGKAPDQLIWKGPFLSEWPGKRETLRVQKQEEEDRIRQTEDKTWQEDEDSPLDDSVPETHGSDARLDSEEEAIGDSNDASESKGAEDEGELPEDWAAQEVAAIFDGPSPERPKKRWEIEPVGWADDWLRKHAKEVRKKRWAYGGRRSSARNGGRAPGCAATSSFIEPSGEEDTTTFRGEETRERYSAVQLPAEVTSLTKILHQRDVAVPRSVPREEHETAIW